MKHFKAVVTPQATSQILTKTTCDLCGTKISYDAYSAEEVEIRHRTGHKYPEFGSGDEATVDMCGKCFDEKLIPWLRSQGAEPKIDEWSW